MLNTMVRPWLWRFVGKQMLCPDICNHITPPQVLRVCMCVCCVTAQPYHKHVCQQSSLLMCSNIQPVNQGVYNKRKRDWERFCHVR